MYLIEALDYTPIELGFGTSGLRGLEIDMTDLECYINATGFIGFLEANNELNSGDTIYIAGDLRKSTPRILSAVAKAVVDKGYTPNYCGLIPTPALAYYAQTKRAACIMVTGSHIPADRNGIKFYKTTGEVLKEDEALIKEHVAQERQRLYSSSSTDNMFTSRGELVDPPDLHEKNNEAETVFMHRYIEPDAQPLKGKQIVVYQHSAVGRDLLVEMLTKLGASVETTGRSDIFIPIDTENVTPQNKEYFRSIAKEFPNAFAIVSTDGDSDRPFVIDENGEFYRGDIVGALVVVELKANKVAVPISCNDAVDTFLDKYGVEIEHTKIGSPYVVSAMAKALPEDIVVGWEVNGGVLLGSEAILNGKKLDKLPTRDAFLPILTVLFKGCKENRKVSDLFKELPARYTGAGLLDNVDEKVINIIRTIHNNELLAKKLVEEKLASDNLGKVHDVNLLDGIRITYATRNVVHIRPSGNAPQLRVYTNTDTQESADALAIEATSKNGLLERFIEAIRAAE